MTWFVQRLSTHGATRRRTTCTTITTTRDTTNRAMLLPGHEARRSIEEGNATHIPEWYVSMEAQPSMDWNVPLDSLSVNLPHLAGWHWPDLLRSRKHFPAPLHLRAIEKRKIGKERGLDLTSLVWFLRDFFGSSACMSRTHATTQQLMGLARRPRRCSDQTTTTRTRRPTCGDRIRFSPFPGAARRLAQVRRRTRRRRRRRRSRKRVCLKTTNTRKHWW